MLFGHVRMRVVGYEAADGLILFFICSKSNIFLVSIPNVALFI